MRPDLKVLARNALGLPNKNKTSFRNRYFTHEDTTAYRGWQELVQGGLAHHVPPERRPTGLHRFYLNRTGAEVVLERGERLDAEDFP